MLSYDPCLLAKVVLDPSAGGREMGARPKEMRREIVPDQRESPDPETASEDNGLSAAPQDNPCKSFISLFLSLSLTHTHTHSFYAPLSFLPFLLSFLFYIFCES